MNKPFLAFALAVSASLALSLAGHPARAEDGPSVIIHGDHHDGHHEEHHVVEEHREMGHHDDHHEVVHEHGHGEDGHSDGRH
ncbi:hypothetical protein [Methylobacterium sp.]|uniref:hypothetical protein n=1 Tax=Methylobacterium sp. TaxID=409 RepID=UPI003B01F333